MENVDENIKTMNKKLAKIKHIRRLNKKKMETLENYLKNIENNYKALKPLKIQSSLGGVKIPKIHKFFEENNYNNEFIKNINDVDLGDDYDDEDTYDQNKAEINYTKKKSGSDKNTFHIKDEYHNNYLKNKNKRNDENFLRTSSIRANSK